VVLSLMSDKCLPVRKCSSHILSRPAHRINWFREASFMQLWLHEIGCLKPVSSVCTPPETARRIFFTCLSQSCEEWSALSSFFQSRLKEKWPRF
jgi:hypothetical protein